MMDTKPNGPHNQRSEYLKKSIQFRDDGYKSDWAAQPAVGVFKKESIPARPVLFSVGERNIAKTFFFN
jgi:hypothetical protein